MNTFKSHAVSSTNGILGCILFFAAAFAILGASSNTAAGAFRGLKIAASIIIPSLFPFTVFAVFFQKSGGLLRLSKSINKVTKNLFRLNGTDFSVILISLLGGYPVGAKIINELYNSKAITAKKAKRLLLFCVNPSPAFFITVVGNNVLCSKNAGWILLISNALTCFTLNVLFKKDEHINKSDTFVPKRNTSDAFVESVYEGSKIIINICAWVTLFSAISALIEPYLNSNIYCFLCPVLEISFGINEIVKLNIPAYLYSFLLSFGGISTLCQVKQAAIDIKPSFANIFIGRAIHGFIATVISYTLFKLFPRNAEVFSNGVQPKFAEYPLLVPSAMLIVFSIMFLAFCSTQKTIDNK